MALAIGVDVGGTKIAGGVVDDSGKIISYTRRDTPFTDPAMMMAGLSGWVRA